MKSFLQEIEDKFIELEEATPEDVELQTKLNQELEKTAELTKQLAGESIEEHLCEKCGQKAHEGHCGSHNEEYELEEASTTAGISGGEGPPKTPFAFGKNDEDTITQAGYSRVQEAMDRKYERLIESYRQFSRGDKKMTPENRVKRTIQEVSKKLKEIETLVKHTSKLKTESGMSRNEYGPRTEKALSKISEKLIKIAERVRALGE
tara:strand:- start:124 stop:741 length:618 start_codon:yes stop_codon:yes gene_type:complete